MRSSTAQRKVRKLPFPAAVGISPLLSGLGFPDQNSITGSKVYPTGPYFRTPLFRPKTKGKSTRQLFRDRKFPRSHDFVGSLKFFASFHCLSRGARPKWKHGKVCAFLFLCCLTNLRDISHATSELLETKWNLSHRKLNHVRRLIPNLLVTSLTSLTKSYCMPGMVPLSCRKFSVARFCPSLSDSCLTTSSKFCT